MVDKHRSVRTSRLIAMDVEGVIIPKRRYLLVGATRRLGYWKTLKVMAIGFFYEVGLLSLESALKRIFMFFQGFTVDDLLQLYKGIPLIPGVEDFFKKVKEAGYQTALISSGLPTTVVEHLATRLKADYAFGLQLKVDDKRLTGEIGGDVIKPSGKALVLKKIIDGNKLSPQNCVVIADDRNNLPMFPLCALRIGYNPDFLVSTKSDLVFTDELSESLPRLTTESLETPHPFLSKSDLVRESIHISGALIPFICINLLDRYLVSLLILFLIILYAASELVRLQGHNVPLFSAVTRRAAIKPELYEFVTSPILFALGITATLILFPVPINYSSIMILALGDGSATLLGKKFGRTVYPFNKRKRIEGSIFGFLLAFLGARLFVDPVRALIGAAAGMLVESLPIPVSDNLAIPIVSGMMMILVP
ncbi:MAG: HAD-IB family phosphatase [Candidatus Bathyarchaeota archaeon]|nr:MAG: HAD-IB family phosphatase [Candidatus Bathyarchaeota archaeon]